MNIALLQLDIQWKAPAVNIAKAERLMSEAPVADLYVLPEMWATGFVTSPTDIAEDEEKSEALMWMKRQSYALGTAICGSLAIRTKDGCYRNRHYFVTPSAVFFYDKHHLFTHGHEHEYYTAGETHTIVMWRGLRFLLLTCYDLRFPVWSRYGVAGEYDAIVCVASWPQSRYAAWDTLTHARAIENQCYVIAVNRVGEDPVSQYNGGSMLIDPVGRTVATCTDNTEQSLNAVLSIDTLNKARSHFRVLDDRD